MVRHPKRARPLWGPRSVKRWRPTWINGVRYDRGSVTLTIGGLTFRGFSMLMFSDPKPWGTRWGHVRASVDEEAGNGREG